MKITCSTPNNGVFFAGELFTCLITLTNEEEKSNPAVSSTGATTAPDKSNIHNSYKLEHSSNSRLSSTSVFGGFLKGFLSNPFSLPQSPSTNLNQLKDAQKNALDQGIMENDSTFGKGIPPLPPVPYNLNIQDDNSPIGQNTTITNHDTSSQISIPFEYGGRINIGHSSPNDIKIQRNFSTYSNTPTIADFDSMAASPGMDQRSHSEEDAAFNNVSSRAAQSSLSIETKLYQPGSAKIAIGFAQIAGQFTIDPHYIKKDIFGDLRNRVLYPLTDNSSKGSLVYGGGSLSTSYFHHERSSKPSKCSI